MTERDWLVERFEGHRQHLIGVAYRMLGSRSEAEDAVQETWLRLGRTDVDDIANLGGWLTTVVGRICLNVLRSRTTRREEPLQLDGTEPVAGVADEPHPENEALLADSVGVALLVVLDTLTPAERLAFVLHDMFDVPFDEIGPVLGRSATATRQLASRARRRVRGASPGGGTDRARQREVVEAFLAAARGGDLDGLIAVLDAGVVLRADRTAVQLGSPARIDGRSAVVETFAGRARGARPALVDGVAGAVWAPGGRPRVVWSFTVEDGRIVGIELVGDAARIGELELTMLER
ncbi:MAG: sigma-70 family RNA polymerase sigma factor [Streptosporangiales bacterium]|nr:sigma-70 family RNA polymerase sigma factor [Streptosporangiales bacterium]